MKSTVYPPLAEAKRYEKEYRSVPVSRTILSDSRTPVEVLRALKAVSRPIHVSGVRSEAGVHLS